MDQGQSCAYGITHRKAVGAENDDASVPGHETGRKRRHDVGVVEELNLEGCRHSPASLLR